MLLRHYQKDVLDRARRRMLTTGKRGIVQGETGSGKSIVIGECCRLSCELAKRENREIRTLILADRRRLIFQLRGTLDKFGVDHGTIMAGETRNTNASVICSSRDTLVSWVDNPERALPRVDMVLIDEAHKSVAAIYSYLLAQYPNAFVIGFTATPARNDGKSLGDFYQWLECTVPASQLIREGWLIKPEVYAPIELAKRRRKGEGKGLAGDPVFHWRLHADGLPTIAFASRVDESIALRDRFIAAGIPAEHIDAKTSDTERDAMFRRLQTGETKVLCSVQLLIEGIDIPEVSAAIIWSKFGSMVAFRQACGRIMRCAPGKTRAVILDHSGAAGVHGCPGEDIEWSLDINSTVEGRRKQAIKEGRQQQTVYCKACGAAFAGSPVCPACGWVLPYRKAKQTMADAFDSARDEILGRLDNEFAADRIREIEQAAWYKAIHTAVKRGGTAGVAAKVFQSQTGKAPWAAGVHPLPENRGDWRQPARDVFDGFLSRRK